VAGAIREHHVPGIGSDAAPHRAQSTAPMRPPVRQSSQLSRRRLRGSKRRSAVTKVRP
jgi:hypothetical protein